MPCSCAGLCWWVVDGGWVMEVAMRQASGCRGTYGWLGERWWLLVLGWAGDVREDEKCCLGNRVFTRFSVPTPVLKSLHKQRSVSLKFKHGFHFIFISLILSINYPLSLFHSRFWFFVFRIKELKSYGFFNLVKLGLNSKFNVLLFFVFWVLTSKHAYLWEHYE